MKTITLLNEKGGVGKTTLSTHIAAGLAASGYTVLMLDADPQANCTTGLGVAKIGFFYDLLIRDMNWRDAMRRVSSKVIAPDHPMEGFNLYIVPGNIETRAVSTNMSDNGVLFRRLRQLRKSEIDFVIIDTGPTPSVLNQAVLLASDYVLIPTQCEAFSALEGLKESIVHVEVARKALGQFQQDGAQLLGIVPNMYRSTTALHRDVLKTIRGRYGALVWEEIPERIAIGEAQAEHRTILRNTGTDEARIMWDMIYRIEQVCNAKTIQ